MKPSELLREVKRRLLAGPAEKVWERDGGSYSTMRGGGRGCVLSHALHVAAEAAGDSERPDWREPFRSAEDALSAELPSRDRYSLRPVADFNDSNPARLWGVIALVGRAIRRLEAEGK